MSHCVGARKSHLCRGSKSPAPMLPCGVASAMQWKWRGGGGVVQVRRRLYVRAEVSVDDVRRRSKKTSGARSQNNRHDDVKVHVRVFHATLKRIGCGISPHTMLERES
jgi:hypothetical protein